jgi:hypothetical protein
MRTNIVFAVRARARSHPARVRTHPARGAFFPLANTASLAHPIRAANAMESVGAQRQTSLKDAPAGAPCSLVACDQSRRTVDILLSGVDDLKEVAHAASKLVEYTKCKRVLRKAQHGLPYNSGLQLCYR